jgi:hypothetical protein
MQPFSSWLSNGKLRASYGQTGNSNVGNRILDTYLPVYGASFGGTYYLGARPEQLGNPRLRWETTTELNLGLDLGFLDNRINLTAEYYDRTISDLLAFEKPLPSYNEITKIAANIGSTQGRGLELTLNTVNVTNRDLQWSTDVTYSFYRDRWKERDPNWSPAVYQSVNDPIRAIFARETDGLLQAGEIPPAYQPSLLPGQIKHKDLSGPDGVPDGKLNDYDVVYLGTDEPDFYFGFNNTLRYKSFDLNVYFYGEINRLTGGSYYEAMLEGIYYSGANVSTLAMDAWYHNQQQTVNRSPIPSDYGDASYYIHKVSYVRCRNITLGYTLPLPQNILQRARIHVDVNNPFVLTNWTGIDPETDMQASSRVSTEERQTYAFPNMVGVSFGVDITF